MNMVSRISYIKNICAIVLVVAAVAASQPQLLASKNASRPLRSSNHSGSAHRMLSSNEIPGFFRRQSNSRMARGNSVASEKMPIGTAFSSTALKK